MRDWSKKMENRDKNIAYNIISVIKELEEYVDEEACKDYEYFSEDRILKRASVMCLISIDELLHSFSPELRKSMDYLNFSHFAAIRFLAERQYENLDFREVWSVICDDIPNLKTYIAVVAKQVSSATRDVMATKPEEFRPAQRVQVASEPEGFRPAPRAQVISESEDFRSAPRAQVASEPEEFRPAQRAQVAAQAYRPSQEFQPVQRQRPEEPQPVQRQQSTEFQPVQRRQAQQQEPPAQGQSNGQFSLDELYRRQAYNEVQKNMTPEEVQEATRNDVNGILALLEREKNSRGIK